tara:strand:- start:683 stop:1396 length:714 start_codon:yes stop_codon:yes gene_type:complete
MICGRSSSSVVPVLEQLSALGQIHGIACDVAEPVQVQALWDAAVERFGRVDIWINNAGVMNSLVDFADAPTEEIGTVVDVNLLGAMYGAHVAFRGMREQQGGGFVYLMEGLGSGGEMRPFHTVYGATKYAVRYLAKALINEAKDTEVRVGSISPGIVVTDLLMDVYKDRPVEELDKAKKVFNILADNVDTVAPWIAERVLAARDNGTSITWLTKFTAFGRFATAAFNKRDLFAEAEA